ncbi:MAG: preprotein translocase subunit SecA [Planctomycetes bacterium]|nr:preprotein translocase subunit SecA [Planctomycetota bacterium]
MAFLEWLSGGLVKMVGGSYNDRTIRRIRENQVRKINALEPSWEGLSDAALREKTVEFRKRLADGETLDDLLPEAFATVREAAKRVLGMRHYDVQLAGGVVLHGGRISEMRTGEGKTLVATLPAYLNALPEVNAATGRHQGVHIVTVNDYLARRDRGWMGKVYEALGLTVGCIQTEMSSRERKPHYLANLTYGTNNEFGFDYLRDNMKDSVEEQVQQTLNYAIVDEVDSVLVDEARTPLIIAGPAGESSEKYAQADKAARHLAPFDTVVLDGGVSINGTVLDKREYYAVERFGANAVEVPKGLVAAVSEAETTKKVTLKNGVELVGKCAERDGVYALELIHAVFRQEHVADWPFKKHFELSEKDSHALLTEEGILRVQQELGLRDIYVGRNVEWPHLIAQALRAQHLFRKEVDYIVEGDEVIIIDEFTGRKMHGRRWSDGLHQAVEAKEGIRIKEETQTYATITFQNFFRLYKKLAGMTGTAMTEAAEFDKVYKVDVLSVPTNRPSCRADNVDLIFGAEKDKYDAIIDKIAELHQAGRPVLVGTTSIEKSEKVSGMLTKRGVPHNVLNAKQHEREARVVADAGRKGAVTIATNMAGRGTDIILGGHVEAIILDEIAQLEAKKAAGEIEAFDAAEVRARIEAETRGKYDEVKALGGLFVLGTERHEARRIDNQLIGRCGRQGDPGETQFYLSLQDDLMRRFANQAVTTWMQKHGFIEGEAIQSGLVSRMIGKAQQRVEQHHFEVRKNLLEYDGVMDVQRKAVYGLRQRVLEGREIRETTLERFHRAVTGAVQRHAPERREEEWKTAELARWFETRFRIPCPIAEWKGLTPDDIEEALTTGSDAAYERVQERIGEARMNEMARYFLLESIDAKWKDHLYEMDTLRSHIGMEGWGGKDPKIVYKIEGFAMFEQMLERIDEEIANRVIPFIDDRLKANDQAEAEAASTAEQASARAPAMDVGAAGLALAGVPAPGVFAGARAAPAGSPGSAPPGESDTRRRYNQAAAGSHRGPSRPVRAQKVPGPNDACPCGSGKKYKTCCSPRFG